MFAWDMDNENLEVLLLRIRVDMVNRRFVKGEIRSSMHMYVQSIPSIKFQFTFTQNKYPRNEHPWHRHPDIQSTGSTPGPR